MANSPEFIENMKPIKDLIQYTPRKLLGNDKSTYALSWYFTQYANIAIKITGGSDIYHHANIIFKGDGHVKIYFYTDTEHTADPYIANVHFSKHRNEEEVQDEIINILIKYGGFKVW